jgi:hypothetical protein
VVVALVVNWLKALAAVVVVHLSAAMVQMVPGHPVVTVEIMSDLTADSEAARLTPLSMGPE